MLRCYIPAWTVFCVLTGVAAVSPLVALLIMSDSMEVSPPGGAQQGLHTNRSLLCCNPLLPAPHCLTSRHSRDIRSVSPSPVKTAAGERELLCSSLPASHWSARYCSYCCPVLPLAAEPLSPLPRPPHHSQSCSSTVLLVLPSTRTICVEW